MLLESYLHARSTFVTLTYAPENLPSDGSLQPRDLVLFLKRLRFNIAPLKVRYFGVGEYGEETWRPHYHLALFGVGREAEQTVQKAWGLGYTHCGDLTVKSAQYVAGYVTKKMTSADDIRLNGRHPEFARMSRNPGIGAHAVEAIAAQLFDREGCKQIALEGDAPAVLKHGKTKMPLGRYLKERLRDSLGFDEKTLPEGKFLQWIEEMRAVQETAKSRGTSFRRELVEDQAILNLETRARVWRKKETL